MSIITYNRTIRRSFVTQLCILSVLAGNCSVLASLETLPVGGRPIGMGSAYVAVAEGPESLFYNPAGLAITGPSALSLFGSRPYGLQELTYETLSALYHSRFGGVGISIQTFGSRIYRENGLAIGWGYHFRNRFYYGFITRIHQIQIKSYGSDSAITLEAGILLIISHRLRWGIAATNINQGSIGQDHEPIPKIIRTGLCYRPMREVLLCLELDKETRFPLELRGGFEIRPLSALALRCGFGRDPSYFSAGIGIAWAFISFDYACMFHPVLGATHQGSFHFCLHAA
jgi:hypothetical protein